jgi:hypothetical protein
MGAMPFAQYATASTGQRDACVDGALLKAGILPDCHPKENCHASHPGSP